MEITVAAIDDHDDQRDRHDPDRMATCGRPILSPRPTAAIGPSSAKRSQFATRTASDSSEIKPSTMTATAIAGRNLIASVRLDLLHDRDHAYLWL